MISVVRSRPGSPRAWRASAPARRPSAQAEGRNTDRLRCGENLDRSSGDGLILEGRFVEW